MRVAVDVAHVEPAAILGRIGRAVEVVDAAIRRLLVGVVHDRLDRPGERRIRAALADVIARLDQVPEVVDHAGAREERALGVDRDPPGVARPLAPDLEDPGLGMDAEDRAGELVRLAVLRRHLAGVEHAVPAVEPAVGAPGQRVGQLVGVGAAEAGRDDLAACRPCRRRRGPGGRGYRASWRPRRRRGRRRSPRGCSGRRRRP